MARTTAPARRVVTRRGLLSEEARRHAPAMLGLAALVVVLFWPVLLGRVFYHRDIHLQWQPQIEAAVAAVAHGSWPVWDPSLGFGQPLLANPNLQLLYPPTWLNLVMRPWTFYTLLVIGHFLLAGVGTYRLALACRLSRMGAFLAAALWIAGGPFVSLVDLWNHLCGAAWIPWSALFALRVAEGGRLRAAWAWGATVAAPILAGSPETALMAAGVGVVLALPALPRARAEGRLRAVLLRAAGAAAVAVLLSAAQWLPSLALARGSTRAHMPEAFRAFWSVHPAVLLEALFPVALDRLPLHWEIRGALFEHREPFLASLYVGLATLALVAAAWRRPTPTKALLTALVVGAIALALGRHLPVYALAVKLLPPLQWLRFPAKLLVVAGLAWALLAGMGLDAWQGDAGHRPRAVLVAVLGLSVLGAGCVAALAAFGAEEWGSALLFRGESLRSFTEILAPSARHAFRAGLAAGAAMGAVFAATRPWSRGWAPLAVVVIVLVDLVATQSGVQPTTTADLYRYRPQAVAAARPAPGERVFAYDYFVPGAGLRYLGHRASYLTAVPEEKWPFPGFEALALRSTLYPSVIGTWGLQAAYTVDPLNLYSTELQSLTALLFRSEGQPAHLRLLQLGGVGTVAALHAQGFEALTPVATFPTLMAEPLRLFRVPSPMPAAVAVSGARVAAGEEALRVVIDPGFDPLREVVLAVGEARATAPDFQATAEIVDRAPDRVRLRAQLSSPGFVVLRDGYDPGWRAQVDGRDAEVLRADVAFRGVAVAAGRHEIEYTYHAPGLPLGLTLSAAALLAGLAAFSRP